MGKLLVPPRSRRSLVGALILSPAWRKERKYDKEKIVMTHGLKEIKGRLKEDWRTTAWGTSPVTLQHDRERPLWLPLWSVYSLCTPASLGGSITRFPSACIPFYYTVIGPSNMWVKKKYNSPVHAPCQSHPQRSCINTTDIHCLLYAGTELAAGYTVVVTGWMVNLPTPPPSSFGEARTARTPRYDCVEDRAPKAENKLKLE